MEMDRRSWHSTCRTVSDDGANGRIQSAAAGCAAVKSGAEGAPACGVVSARAVRKYCTLWPST